MFVRKENSLLHILVRAILADSTFPNIPEDSGLPLMILYGSNAVSKLRRQTPDASQILPVSGVCIFKLYRGRLGVTEQLPTNEWDMVGSWGTETITGLIPAYHRLQTQPEAIPLAPAVNH
jgi:hypothetical protein